MGKEEETEEMGDHDDAADQAEEPAGHDRDESTKKGENKPQTTDKKDADENKDDADKVIALKLSSNRSNPILVRILPIVSTDLRR